MGGRYVPKSVALFMAVFASLVGCALSYGQSQIRSETEDVAQAVSDIERMGGTIARDATTAVIGVDLRGTNITDASLEHLSALRQLKSLDLSGWRTQVSDVGLAQLEGCCRPNSLPGVGSFWLN